MLCLFGLSSALAPIPSERGRLVAFFSTPPRSALLFGEIDHPTHERDQQYVKGAEATDDSMGTRLAIFCVEISGSRVVSSWSSVQYTPSGHK